MEWGGIAENIDKAWRRGVGGGVQSVKTKVSANPVAERDSRIPRAVPQECPPMISQM